MTPEFETELRRLQAAERAALREVWAARAAYRRGGSLEAIDAAIGRWRAADAALREHWVPMMQAQLAAEVETALAGA